MSTTNKSLFETKMFWFIIFITFLTCIALSYFVGPITTINISSNQIDTVTVVREVNKAFELELINTDLKSYDNREYSDRYVNIILNSHEKYSKEYNIPIGLGYAIGRVESDYNLESIHAPITIKSGKFKGKTTRAVGLSGIVWEYNYKILQENGIETRNDLFMPDINIKAMYIILNDIVKREIERNSEYTIINTIVRRYYGAYDHDYKNKLEKYTSDLWMKRIAKEIFDYHLEIKNDKIINNSDSTMVVDSLDNIES